ncbi:MAG TPA: chemotaxis protein CheA, partial [Dongiaceae bacterium]|nr:chemotaxis protein CheA [Dongiaceae bacterium]
IVKARLEQLAAINGQEKLSAISEELTRLGLELRDNAFDIRMLPIGSTFARFRRLIRDLSAELGKEVQFETEGADTELDKMVLDKLSDPLIHLLRNSLDHGIESPEQRIQNGKSAKGTIRLSARHVDGQILIMIEDDGAGLHKERILAKARERKLIGPDQQLEDREIFQLIFQPGFSTAAKVTDISGRGVGMDVVRSSIDNLQGRIQLDSSPGRGTRISIYLPMTLAIIEGLMVRVEGDYFVLPLSVVEECIETTTLQHSRKDGGRLVEHRGQLIPCARLRDSFSIPGQRPVIEQTIVTRASEQTFGITVDEVVGQYQTVIKDLGPLYKGTPGIMGATITGDGSVAMIIDINQLAEDASPAPSQAARRQGALC